MKQVIGIRIIVAIAIILGLIATFSYKYITIGDSNKSDKIYAVVIDVSGKLEMDESDILSGREPILLRVSNSEDGPSPLVQVLSFDNISQLLGFSEDNHGYIDASNPIFAELYVALLDEQHKKLEKLPLQKAGFTAIAFEPDFINAALSAKVNQFDNGVGNIVQQHNRRFILKLIQVDGVQLDELVHAGIEPNYIGSTMSK